MNLPENSTHLEIEKTKLDFHSPVAHPKMFLKFSGKAMSDDRVNHGVGGSSNDALERSMFYARCNNQTHSNVSHRRNPKSVTNSGKNSRLGSQQTLSQSLKISLL